MAVKSYYIPGLLILRVKNNKHNDIIERRTCDAVPVKTVLGCPFLPVSVRLG